MAAILWAASFVISAKVLRNLDPLSTNAFRSLFSTISIVIIAFFMGEIQKIPNIDPYGLIVVILAALIGFGIGDSLLYKSITSIGVSKAYTIAHSYPFFTMIFAIIFLEETFFPKYLLGTIIIFFGISVLVVDGNSEHKVGSHLGFITALVAAISWSTGLILITVGITKMSVILANTIRFPFLFLCLILMSRPWVRKVNLSKGNLALLATSGILGMTLAGIIFLFGIKFIGISRATSLGASSPVWASLMSGFFLKEKVTGRVIISALMVVVGIYFLT